MSIDDHYHGFREGYLDYETLTEQLHAWAAAFPEVTRLQSLGTTHEGRALWLLTIGTDPDSPAPAVWVDGNMHAAEISGSSVALAIAEAALRLHVEDTLPADVPAATEHTLRGIQFHVCPRVSPDGAAQVFARGGFVRSVPRSVYGPRDEPHWQDEDLDGDGVIRYMRVEDPAGDFVPSADHPGLMLPRRIQDPPPYYRVYREGLVANWDGRTIPAPEFLTNTTDLNRNFPWDWRPEPEQPGAGAYPGSEPESRAVLDWTSRHPEIFAWLNLHTFGGVFIRPLGHQPDSRMHRADLALYRQLGAWGDELVGYPTVSGYEEFTYEPERPLHGDLTDHAYNNRGCLAIVCELWDLFVQADLPTPRPFVHRYTALERDHLRDLAAWDRDHNAGRIFQPWRRHEHPQLGPVELGGPDPRIGIWNPPPDRLPGICERLTAYWLRVASLLPRIVVERLEAHAVEEGLWRLDATIANHGYLPTWGLDSALDHPWNTPLQAEIACSAATILEPTPAAQPVGHLRGWGRGLGHGGDTPMFLRSAGNDHRCTLSWWIRGSGEVRLAVRGRRTGTVRATLDLDEAGG